MESHAQKRFGVVGIYLVCASAMPLIGCDEVTQPVAFVDVSFPDGFAFGTAISQWQTSGDEGVEGVVDSNWSRWAAMGKIADGQTNPSGNGFMTMYADDIARAKELGLDTFRLGIDWSRIEPVNGDFSDAELAHLVEVLEEVHAQGLRPALTLWHWVVPTWVQNPDDSNGAKVDLFADLDSGIVDEWDAYVRFVIPAVASLVDTYTVLNEPFSVISAGYLGGVFPPGRVLDIDGGTACGINLMKMHARAYDIIKELDDVDADGDGKASFVGLTKTANEFYPVNPDSVQEQASAEQVSYVFNDWMMVALTSGELDVNLDGRIEPEADTNPAEGVYDDLAGRLDFVGVQYYGPVFMRSNPLYDSIHPVYGEPVFGFIDERDSVPRNGMDREISAAGFAHTIDRYAEYGIPIVMTENGTTTNPPKERTEDAPHTSTTDEGEAQAARYIVEHLWEVGRAIDRGVDIRGYYHWSIADNFEWAEGWHQRFGAFSVDAEDSAKARRRTKLADALADIVGARGIDEKIWGDFGATPFLSGREESTTAEPLYQADAD